MCAACTGRTPYPPLTASRNIRLQTLFSLEGSALKSRVLIPHTLFKRFPFFEHEIIETVAFCQNERNPFKAPEPIRRLTNEPQNLVNGKSGGFSSRCMRSTTKWTILLHKLKRQLDQELSAKASSGRESVIIRMCKS